MARRGLLVRRGLPVPWISMMMSFTQARVTSNKTVQSMCGLRDRANTLVGAVKAGRIPAADANEQLDDLRQ